MYVISNVTVSLPIPQLYIKPNRVSQLSFFF